MNKKSITTVSQPEDADIQSGRRVTNTPSTTSPSSNALGDIHHSRQVQIRAQAPQVLWEEPTWSRKDCFDNCSSPRPPMNWLIPVVKSHYKSKDDRPGQITRILLSAQDLPTECCPLDPLDRLSTLFVKAEYFKSQYAGQTCDARSLWLGGLTSVPKQSFELPFIELPIHHTVNLTITHRPEIPIPPMCYNKAIQTVINPLVLVNLITEFVSTFPYQPTILVFRAHQPEPEVLRPLSLPKTITSVTSVVHGNQSLHFLRVQPMNPITFEFSPFARCPSETVYFSVWHVRQANNHPMFIPNALLDLTLKLGDDWSLEIFSSEQVQPGIWQLPELTLSMLLWTLQCSWNPKFLDQPLLLGFSCAPPGVPPFRNSP